MTINHFLRSMIVFVFVRVLIFVIALAIIGYLVAPALAQDTPTSPVTDTGPNSLDALIALLTTALIVPIAGTLVTLLTNGLKLLIPLPAGVLALIVALVIWVIWYLSNAFGYGDLFNALVPQLESVIQVVLAIAGIVLTTGGSSAVFRWSVNNRVPLLSYQRTV